jgi:DNA repair exonuclease SbcCD nuclease subunit
MPRLAFLTRTDVHVSDRSPISWKGDYPAEIWSNLEQIGRIAKEREATAVLDAGDYFHVKASSKNSHALVERSARIHKVSYSCPVWEIEGNHDISFNNLDTLGKQPLGVLYATGVFQRLREQVFTDGNLQVRVVGVPYSPNRTLDELLQIQKKPGDTHLIAMVHALAGKNPPAQAEDFFNEPVFPYEALISRNGPDVWCFGHWHKDQGVEVIHGRQFINVGAVSRGALVRENLERTPKVALIEIDNGVVTVTPILLSVAPAADVFDLEKKASQEKERRDIDQFVLQLLTDGAIDPAASIEANIRNLNFADDVREEALRYLELVESVG